MARPSAPHYRNATTRTQPTAPSLGDACYCCFHVSCFAAELISGAASVPLTRALRSENTESRATMTAESAPQWSPNVLKIAILYNLTDPHT